MAASDTKNRILDAAERLFAVKGVHNTSLRTITREAGVNLAAVNYHFGSKDGLIRAIFKRRIGPLNRERMDRLRSLMDEFQGKGDVPEVRSIFQALMEPAITIMDSQPGAKYFVAIVGHAMADPDEHVRTLFLSEMKEVYSLLFQLLSLALPALDKKVLFWRLQFALGAMAHTLIMAGKFRLVPEDVDPPEDAATLAGLLVDFVTAGMECGPDE